MYIYIHTYTYIGVIWGLYRGEPSTFKAQPEATSPYTELAWPDPRFYEASIFFAQETARS